MQREPVGGKQVTFFVFFAFAMLIVLLTFVSTFSKPSGSGGFPPAFGYGVGGVAILAAAILATTWLRPFDGLPFPRFQQQMLICLAVSEFGTLIGFVMHLGSGAPMWPLAAGSLVVDLALILPRLLGYWRMNGQGGGTRRL